MSIRAILGWLMTDASGSKQRSNRTAIGLRLIPLSGTLPSPVRPKPTAAETASVYSTYPKTVYLLLPLPQANLTSHSLCHIAEDMFVGSGMSNLAKGVPFQTVDMNTCAIIVCITLQPTMSIIRLYIAQAVPANNLPLPKDLNHYSHDTILGHS